ncbi:hypothetical protein C9I98_13090 [Photobacterium sanctipauli]|uniref:Oxidoreductase n=3 Tax=Photobacterium sanctipauli TaxID=1342794 RepID=A0A2T3NST4_9GAMM|nr:hypothetical protein C9I98_13090 [Photobacterium sanctipauli]
MIAWSVGMEANKTYNVILCGAGFISNIHASTLNQLKNTNLVAIVDPNQDAARKLAKQFNIPHTFTGIQEALNTIEFDTAHILAPPNHHYSLTHALLSHDKHVLVEKPLAETAAECDELAQLAKQKGVTLAVNQNFIFHPALLKAKALLADGKIGPVKSVKLDYEMPLRQLDAGQYGHWMFSKPVNILLEQAVHPISQLFSLFGLPRGDTQCRASQPTALTVQLPFIKRLDIMGELNIPYHFSFAMGQDFPVWQMKIIGEDGVLNVDFINNQLSCQTRSRFLPALDIAVSATRQASSVCYQGLKQLFQYSTSIAGLTSSKDPFSSSMKASMVHFYQALDQQVTPVHSGDFGHKIISFCHTLAQQGFPDLLDPLPAEAPTDALFDDEGKFDVLVIGGTGFIGRQVIKRLQAENYSIGVMARNINALPSLFHQPGITLLKGNVRDSKAVSRAISKATYVINLAHGGGSGSWQEIHDAMVGSAETVANACLQHKIERLVHVGSIASLYLGDTDTITSETPPDPQPELRADYSRAKALADELLLTKYPQLDFVLLRPGVVIGEGGLINHTGVGFFNNCQHFIGWNRGNNALPFVLVEDVANATVAALTAKNAKGKALNLVGDIRLNAKEYVSLLRNQLERPYQFISQPTEWLYAQELGKWAVKRIAGRKTPMPALRDLRSRAMTASFDNTTEKALLNWQPTADKQEFIQRAIAVHKPEATAQEEQAS